ncbi:MULTISPECIES: DUF3347 domain-containing protein [Aequorivita]|jgi:hypothetical protein|uniref:DUF3347 domain-containing protein n=1 Tax=Aequorivita iocasae TaxID=2803865 RepID=A0ABX7DVN6_9FLAO|nr:MULTISPECIES: DUF3347 domain-containing protein [Aequorivita]MRT16792.1 DUF3347 domain-containing protein [Aequorivita lutea]QQX78059.1 DUF3347 domain-containing protein [Aequorivita iocasae]UCA57566.1 DUF3347 domain-containing protein [Aequorivita sp. F7]
MKHLKVTTSVLALAFVGLTAMSCKDGKKEEHSDDAMNTEMSSEEGHHHEEGMEHDEMDESNNTMNSEAQASDVKQVMADYMSLKDALVATDKDAAAKAGKTLESALRGLNISSYTAEQQKELKDIVADATEHAEHIGKSEMDHQREHFKTLSKDMIDMVAITGIDSKMYQMHCPMYDGGSEWLSMEKEVKNPYYGSKMMGCGKVEKEIN